MSCLTPRGDMLHMFLSEIFQDFCEFKKFLGNIFPPLWSEMRELVVNIIITLCVCEAFSSSKIRTDNIAVRY